jgi:hypothetical protein
VLAFLKRRWILLSCSVVLLACSVMDLRWITCTDSVPVQGFSNPFGDEPRYKRVAVRERSLFAGSIRFHYANSAFEKEGANYSPLTFRLHSPRFGALPVWNFAALPNEVSIPLWLPLATVLGWLVFRELRWREKRAKAAEASSAQ